MKPRCWWLYLKCLTLLYYPLLFQIIRYSAKRKESLDFLFITENSSRIEKIQISWKPMHNRFKCISSLTYPHSFLQMTSDLYNYERIFLNFEEFDQRGNERSMKIGSTSQFSLSQYSIREFWNFEFLKNTP